MSAMAPKWAVGNAYGPVLSSNQLYLLQASAGCKCLELNPILTHTMKKFHIIWSLSTGISGGYDPADQAVDLPLTDDKKDQPATVPRVEELYIITKLSPWVTTVKASDKKRGVSLGDIINAATETYGQNVTDEEFSVLGIREQERARRASTPYRQDGMMGGYFSPPAQTKLRRADWLMGQHYFDGLEADDDYSLSRLGFKAPNVFVMNFIA